MSQLIRTILALVSGQFVNVATQLLLPPLFLSSYGVQRYGEWLLLTSGVSWISMLDLGMHAYLVNELSIRFRKGETQRFRESLSSNLRVSISLCTVATVAVAVLAHFSDVGAWAHLNMERNDVTLIAALLALQIGANIVWGQINGVLRAIGHQDKGEWLLHGARLMALIATICGVLVAIPLPFLPLLPLATLFIPIFLAFLLIREIDSSALPTIRLWNPSLVREAMVPSLWFASFSIGQLISLQAPILALGMLNDKTALVSFSIARTYFGIARQMTNMLRFSVRSEITHMYASSREVELSRLIYKYDRLVVTAAISGTCILLAAASLVMPLWGQAGKVYSVVLFWFFAPLTVVAILKDCRQEILYATSRHERFALHSLLWYVVAGTIMLALPRTTVTPVLCASLIAVAELIQLYALMWLCHDYWPKVATAFVNAKLILAATSIIIAFAWASIHLLPNGARHANLALAGVVAAAGLAYLYRTGSFSLFRQPDRVT